VFYENSVQILNGANTMSESLGCIFNQITMHDCGEPHASRIRMSSPAEIETSGRAASRKSLALSGTTLGVACIVIAIGISASAQSLGGSLGRRGTSSNYSTLTTAAATINLSAVVPATLGVSVSNVHLMVSVKDPNIPTEVIQVPVTSFWRLGSSSNGVELVGYFESPAEALVDAQGHAIPSTRVEAAIRGEQSAPFTETAGIGTTGGSRTLYRQAISLGNFSGFRNDVIEIRVARVSDLGLQSGAYGGTLHLRMLAY
jgi:hypothetical protein